MMRQFLDELTGAIASISLGILFGLILATGWIQ
jgi:hypothetical protein